MTWFDAAPTIGLALAVLFLPGGLLGAAVGLRRFALLAVAPALSVAFASALAIVLPYTGLPWTFVTVTVAAALLAAIVWLLRRFVGKRAEPSSAPLPGPRPVWPAVTAVGVAVGLLTVQLLIVFGQPDSISQTFDSAFHLNGVRYILESGSASSFDLSGFILPEGRSSFYPAAWHDVVSLVAGATGGSIPVAVNVTNLVIGAVVWPLGCLYLVRIILPGNVPALLAAAVLSASLPAFPVLMLDYGVLYSYFTGLALLPIALAIGFDLLRVGGPRTASIPVLSILLASSLVAIGLAQPAVAFAWAAFVAAAVTVLVLQWARHPRPGRQRLLALTGLAVGLAVLAVAWIVFGRVGANSPWPTYTNAFGAVFEVLTYSMKGTPVAVALSLLTVVGLVQLARTPGQRWLLAVWAVGAFLFAVSVAFPSWSVRALVVGLFYRDPPRLASLLMIVALPVAVVGAVAVWQFLTHTVWPRVAARLRHGSAPAAAVVSTVAVFVVFLASSQGIAVRYAVDEAQWKYDFTPWAPLVSADEIALLERIGDELPEDAVIAGNPWTGTSYAYAIADRTVLTPHFNALTDPLAPVVNLRLNQAAEDPEVCDAVRSLGVGYVLDFGIYSRDAGDTDVEFLGMVDYVGLVDLVDAGVVEEVDREGAAALYRITACGDIG
jgi:hypothetical protein